MQCSEWSMECLVWSVHYGESSVECVVTGSRLSSYPWLRSYWPGQAATVSSLSDLYLQSSRRVVHPKHALWIYLNRINQQGSLTKYNELFSGLSLHCTEDADLGGNQCPVSGKIFIVAYRLVSQCEDMLHCVCSPADRDPRETHQITAEIPSTTTSFSPRSDRT